MNGPDVEIPFDPPFLFDCRHYPDRRMGLGDQVVLIGMIQRVAAVVGRENVRVVYDPDYPGSRSLWELQDVVPTAPVVGSVQLSEETGESYVPCRQHFLESRCGRSEPCEYGQAQGYPGAQWLYNLGWQDLLNWWPVEFSLRPTPPACRRAEALIAALLPSGQYTCCNAIESTRGNVLANECCWFNLVADQRETNPGRALCFGCARSEYPRLRAFLRLAGIEDVVIVAESLDVWLAMIQRSAGCISGNTGGLWLALAAKVPLTVVQAATNEHGIMWNARHAWLAEGDRFRLTIQPAART